MLTHQQEGQKEQGKGSRQQLIDKALQKRFGQRIHELRLKRGYSQEELSSVAGLNRTYLSDIERGEGNATLDVMSRLSSALGIELAQLFSGIYTSGTRVAHILVAGKVPGNERLLEVLNGHNVTFCHQLKEAGRMLEECDFDVVVCEMGFAEGRMFDLLRLLRLSERHKETPFITLGNQVTDDTCPLFNQAVRIAVSALGGSTFIQLNGGENQQEADWQLKQAVELFLARRVKQ
jgi:transcriptional regulator with XRE-family HTH domain